MSGLDSFVQVSCLKGSNKLELIQAATFFARDCAGSFFAGSGLEVDACAPVLSRFKVSTATIEEASLFPLNFILPRTTGHGPSPCVCCTMSMSPDSGRRIDLCAYRSASLDVPDYSYERLLWMHTSEQPLPE